MRAIPFKTHLKDELTEKFISEMSVYDPKYPVGTEFMPSPSANGKKIETLNKYGIPVTKDSILTKIDPTDGAMEVGTGSGNKIYFSFQDKNYVLHRPDAGTFFKKALKADGMTWNDATLETAACLGLIFDGESALTTFTNKDSSEKENKKIVSEIQSAFMKDMDWMSAGVAEIDRSLAEYENINVADMSQLLSLASGMTTFANTLPGNFKYFIHNRIDAYYSAESENQTTTGKKKNTADCVLSTHKPDQTIELMKTGKASFDSQGIITLTSGSKSCKIIQVSLKKAKGKAQLGKIFQQMKARYGVADFSDLIDTALDEGFFDNFIKNITKAGAYVFDHIRGLYNKVFSRLMKFQSVMMRSFKKKTRTNGTKEMSKLMKESNISLREEYLAEGKNPANILDTMSIQDLRKIAQTIEGRLLKLNNIATRNKSVAMKYDTIPIKITGDESLDDKNKLFSNYVSLTTTEEIIEKSGQKAKGLAKEVADLQKEMFFGKTDLPVYKVFGAKKAGDTNTYEYLGSAQDFVQDKMKMVNYDVPLIGINSSNQGPYYTLYSSFCMGINEEGELQYSQNRMGTNKGGGVWSYTYEGYQILTQEKFEKMYVK